VKCVVSFTSVTKWKNYGFFEQVSRGVKRGLCMSGLTEKKYTLSKDMEFNLYALELGFPIKKNT